VAEPTRETPAMPEPIKTFRLLLQMDRKASDGSFDEDYCDEIAVRANVQDADVIFREIQAAVAAVLKSHGAA